MSYVTLVDLPGSSSLSRHTDIWIRKADAVIFVIDGAAYRETVHDAAKSLVLSVALLLSAFCRKLHKITEDPVLQRTKRAPTLIAVNKSDLGARVHTTRFIKHNLQCEMWVSLVESLMFECLSRLCVVMTFGCRRNAMGQERAFLLIRSPVRWFLHPCLLSLMPTTPSYSFWKKCTRDTRLCGGDELNESYRC